MDSPSGWVTFLTVVAGFAYQAWRDERRRKWEVEDRLSIAVTLAKHSASLVKGMAVDSAATAETLALHTTATSERLEGLIARNTELTQEGVKAAGDAYHEANTVNIKLEQLGLEHNAIDRIENAAAAERDRRSTDRKG